MVVEQATQTRSDEHFRCKDLAWTMIEEQNKDGLAEPKENEVDSVVNEALQTRFEGLIHAGQKVFLTDARPIGRIEKIMPGAGGEFSYLVIRTGHLWRRSKLIPAVMVDKINPKGAWLSIDRDKFKASPDYKSDETLCTEVKSALWNDKVLKVTDYREIDVRLKNGVVCLTGHITSMMNHERIESALKNVKGLLGVKNHLVADDTLLLKVAEALSQIERGMGHPVFANVQNGVVTLNGKVISAEARSLAEHYTAIVPSVRGVINNIAVPGFDLDVGDQRFLQPVIGEEILFRDGLSGLVKRVIINRNNRRVVGMIIQGRFPDELLKFGVMAAGETLTPERLAVIPVALIRYLTSSSGFLLIDSTDTTRYTDFDPINYVVPDAEWVPPYPYCADDVRFSVGS